MGACSIDNRTPNSTIKCRFAKICNFTCPKPQIQEHQEKNKDFTWLKIREEAMSEATREPILKDYYCETVLSHASLESALASLLAAKLSGPSLSKAALLDILFGVMAEDEAIGATARDDLRAARERDPACLGLAHCLLNFKGFQACQAHRAAHGLWSRGRTALAVLIQSRASEVFGVDIHPGARIGSGVAVVGDHVTILHGVTLGGTGKVSGDRHPKIGDGVFIGAGSKILGCVRIGSGARVGAGSVVLKEVPPNATAVGNPARVIGG